jgi:hypothetical protein
MGLLSIHAPRYSFGNQLGTTIVQWLAAERQKCHVAGLLDCGRYHTLVFRARAGLAAWSDLAFFGYILAEQVGLFVINDQQLIRAKLTKLGLCEKLAVTTAAFAA